MSVASSSESELDLVGVGECMVELSSARAIAEAETFDVGYGGDVMNALVMAAKLGARVGYVSKVGDDAFGHRLMAAWAREGIDLRSCRLVPGMNGLYVISALPGGDHEFWYYRTGSAASTLCRDDVDEAYVASGRSLLVSGITQAISPSAQAATLHAARTARAAGALVFYDPNVRMKLWAERSAHDADGRSPHELVDAAVREVLPYVDVVLPSHPSDAVGVLGDVATATIEQHAQAYADLGCTCVGMKLGAAGSMVFRNGVSAAQDAPVAHRFRDATGAGDAWNAAFIWHTLQGADAREAAGYANAVATWKVQFRGAIPADAPASDLVRARIAHE